MLVFTQVAQEASQFKHLCRIVSPYYPAEHDNMHLPALTAYPAIQAVQALLAQVVQGELQAVHVPLDKMKLVLLIHN